ncbi:MAG TPA: hypothetical protein VK753_04290 [Xanthomonadaceae bacterium]|jgi:hypothetical protein|nr:hypothetical protein [Xanthomonadaceae bacterium]
MNEVNASPGNPASGRRYRGGEVVGGVVVILIGLAFLAGNLGIDLPLFGWHNGWALFILIGAAAPLGRAVERYRDVGRIDGQAMHSLLTAATMVAIASMFFLDVSFALWWPMFAIVGGLYMLFPGDKRRNRDDRRFHSRS